MSRDSSLANDEADPMSTERPSAFGESYYNTRSRDDEFGIGELRPNARDEREGSLIPAANPWFGDEGRIVIESTPYSTSPQRLMGVREWT